MGEKLTKADVRELRRPYHTNAVKWLPIGKVAASGVMMLPHIDASLVIERLSEVDPAWHEETVPMLLGANPADPFGLTHMAPWRCTLTVGGVTRSGVGQLDALSNKADGKHLKAGESDALKRAALKFGVGAYLRAIPTTWLEQNVGGKETFKTSEYNGKKQFRGLTATGKMMLRAQYEKVIGHAAFEEHYGAMVDYGDLADEGEERVVEPADTPAGDRELEVLVLMSKYTGRDQPEDYVRATFANKPFGKSLAQALQSVKANLGVAAEDTERLRVLATDASTGSDEALAELTNGLDQLADIADTGAGEEQEQMPV